VLVGDPSRAYLPRDRFEQVAIYQVPVSQQLEDADIKPTTIWRLA
jgi:predicted nicotinamide N-methyase